MRADGNKAPSANGFTFRFVQTFWKDLKGELLKWFQTDFAARLGSQVSYTGAGCKTERCDGKSVSDTQSKFIKGRSIFNWWTFALEVLNAMRRFGDGVVFKIVFEKTYNCVDWDFL